MQGPMRIHYKKKQKDKKKPVILKQTMRTNNTVQKRHKEKDYGKKGAQPVTLVAGKTREKKEQGRSKLL